MANVGFHTKPIEIFSTSDAWVGVVSSSSQAFKVDVWSCRRPFSGSRCIERAGGALGNGDGQIKRRGRPVGRQAGRQESRHVRAESVLMSAFVAGYGTLKATLQSGNLLVSPGVVGTLRSTFRDTCRSCGFHESLDSKAFQGPSNCSPGSHLPDSVCSNHSIVGSRSSAQS